MKIAFIGFGKVAECSLLEMIKKGFLPVCVMVPKNKKSDLIKNICKKNNIKIFLVKNGKEIEDVLHEVTSLDVAIIASFPYLLPKKILSIPKYGFINIHGSLLPKYRGYHPVHWAILNNEVETGVTLHFVDEFADSGDIIVQKKIVITDSDDINTLIQKISKLGAELLIKVLIQIRNKKKIKRRKQKIENVTFAPKRYPKDGRISWNSSGRKIFNLVRALKSPYTNAFSLRKNGSFVSVNETFIAKKSGKILAEIDDYYLVTTRDGVILIKTDKKLQIGEELI